MMAIDGGEFLKLFFTTQNLFFSFSPILSTFTYHKLFKILIFCRIIFSKKKVSNGAADNSKLKGIYEKECLVAKNKVRAENT